MDDDPPLPPRAPTRVQTATPVQAQTGPSKADKETLKGMITNGGSTNPVSGCGNFLIVYGEPGLGEHSAGDNFHQSANTHYAEVSKNLFPGVPHYNPKCSKLIGPILINGADALVSALSAGDIIYLAYFGHSWAGKKGETEGGETIPNDNDWGILGIGEHKGKDTNLGISYTTTEIINTGKKDKNGHQIIQREINSGYDATSTTTLPRSKFRNNAQIRLFGCRGGYGTNSVAQQIANHLALLVYAYANNGGSVFTKDIILGHGKRSIKIEETQGKAPNGEPKWLVTANGSQKFTLFTKK